MDYIKKFKERFISILSSYEVRETCFEHQTIFGVLTLFEFETTRIIADIRLYDSGLYIIVVIDKLTFNELLNVAWLKDDDLLDEMRILDFESFESIFKNEINL
jgi:hypothetical protein